MKKKVMLLLIIFLVSLTVQSCRTITYRLTADEVLPTLVDKDQAIVDLIFNHYYWKLKANDDRYIVGEITMRERDQRRKAILDEIASMADN